MNDILSFKKMITPTIIQGLFILGCLGAVIYGFGMMKFNFLLGLFSIVGGVIFVRVYCELMILLFRINDSLNEIRENTKR